MEKGEHWAFRRTARSNTWHEVNILAVGAKVKIQFEEDKFEGRQEWVSAARLETPWDDLDGYVADERRYRAMRDACNASRIESRAYLEVLSQIPNELAEVSTLEHGETVIYDVDGLARFLQLDPTVLLGADPTWDDRGELHVPQAVTERIVRAAAPLVAAPLLAAIRDVEHAERIKSITGEYSEDLLGNGDGSGEVYIPADRLARSFEKHLAPAHTLVRRWTGQQVSERFDKVEALRSELARVMKIAHWMLRDLEALRSNTTAAKHRKALLTPSLEWMGYGIFEWDLKSAEQYLYRYRWDEDCNCTFGTPGRSPHREHDCMKMTENENWSRVLPSDVSKGFE